MDVACCRLCPLCLICPNYYPLFKHVDDQTVDTNLLLFSLDSSLGLHDIPLPNGCAMTNKPTPFLCLCVTAFIIPFTVSFVPPEVTSSVASLSSSTSRFANQSGDEIPTVYPLSRRKVMLIEEAKKLDPAIASGNKVGKTLIFSGSAVVCPSSIVLCNI